LVRGRVTHLTNSDSEACKVKSELLQMSGFGPIRPRT